MKTFKYLCMFFAALTLSLTTTSCGGDDDDLEDIEQKVEEGVLKTTVTLKESKDQIVLTAKTGSVCTQTYTAKFKDDKCTSCTFTAEFANKKLADAFEQEMKGEMEVKRNGNSFSGDLTEEYEGLSYSDMKNIFMMIKRGMESDAASAASR